MNKKLLVILGILILFFGIVPVKTVSATTLYIYAMSNSRVYIDCEFKGIPSWGMLETSAPLGIHTIKVTASEYYDYIGIINVVQVGFQFESTTMLPLPLTCGNGVKDIGEVCDGSAGCALPKTCTTACNACNPPGVVCGNCTKDAGEVCDGAIDCALPGICSSTCDVCNPPSASCGNGIKEGAEVCDGAVGCAAPNICVDNCHACNPPPSGSVTIDTIPSGANVYSGSTASPILIGVTPFVYKLPSAQTGYFFKKSCCGDRFGYLSPDTTDPYVLTLTYTGNCYTLPLLTTITVSPASASISSVGSTKAFVASPKDQLGNSINAEITWSSSNSAVAAVNSSGVVTGISVGTATIIASFGTIQGTATVTVGSAAAVCGNGIKEGSEVCDFLGNVGCSTPNPLCKTDCQFCVNTASLTVLGDIVGADIYIDGVFKGHSYGNYYNTFVLYGAHTLKVTKSGYQDYVAVINIVNYISSATVPALVPLPSTVCGNGIKEGAEVCDGADGCALPNTCAAACDACNPPPSGSVTIKSCPSGATVYLGAADGYTIIGVTPFIYELPDHQMGLIFKKQYYGTNFGYVGPTTTDPLVVILYYWGPGGTPYTEQGWCGVHGDGKCPGECTVACDSDCPVVPPACTDDCDNPINYECGTQMVCGAPVNCGSCTAPDVCDAAGQCVPPPPPACTDTCVSLGFQCGTQTICGVATNCGFCAIPDVCNAAGQCVPPPPPACTDTCVSLGLECGTQMVCGAPVNCGSCTAPDVCDAAGQCVPPPPPACTDTCVSLGFQCGIQTICGVATNCGFCTLPNVCDLTGHCFAPPFPLPPTPPTVPWKLTATGSITVPAIDLAWRASTDDRGVAGYNIYKDGIKIATVNRLFYTDTDVVFGATHIYTVSAFDVDGNKSAQSDSAAAMSAPISTEFARAVSASDFSQLIGNFLKWILTVAGSLALLIIIIGGVMYISSSGDEQKTVLAKKIVMGAIGGLILILIAYSIITLLGKIV